MNHKKGRGFTLVELVLAIVIIAITITGTLLVFQTTTRFSGDPMILQQATTIAKSYLEEILAKSFPNTTPCSAPPAGGRPDFATVCDYDNLSNNGATDQTGQVISGLEAYTIDVSVNTASATLGGLAAGSQVVRVDVNVSHPSIPTLTFSGYRTCMASGGSC